MGGYHHKSNAALVVYTGAERGSEESTCGRCSESNDSYLFLSGSDGGEDEFISEESVKASHRHRNCGIMCLCGMKKFCKSEICWCLKLNYFLKKSEKQEKIFY